MRGKGEGDVLKGGGNAESPRQGWMGRICEGEKLGDWVEGIVVLESREVCCTFRGLWEGQLVSDGRRIQVLPWRDQRRDKRGSRSLHACCSSP